MALDSSHLWLKVVEARVSHCDAIVVFVVARRSTLNHVESQTNERAPSNCSTFCVCSAVNLVHAHSDFSLSSHENEITSSKAAVAPQTVKV